MTVFTTERTVVRPWRPDDAADVDRAFDTYARWDVARWLGASPRALEARADAATLLERWADRNAALATGGIWAVERRDEGHAGEVAGTVLLVPLPDGDGEYEVGWHLHPDAWGHGLASEAARGALQHAFDAGLETVLAVVRPDNARSLAVCQRVGMEPMGRTDRYYGTTLELFAARNQSGNLPHPPGRAG